MHINLLKELIILEKHSDYGNFPPYNDLNYEPRINDAFNRDPIFNPISQYEQAYMYYKYLNSQMEYKIRCKEYEKMCKSDNKMDKRIVEEQIRKNL